MRNFNCIKSFTGVKKLLLLTNLSCYSLYFRSDYVTQPYPCTFKLNQHQFQLYEENKLFVSVLSRLWLFVDTSGSGSWNGTTIVTLSFAFDGIIAMESLSAYQLMRKANLTENTQFLMQYGLEAPVIIKTFAFFKLILPLPPPLPLCSVLGLFGYINFAVFPV